MNLPTVLLYSRPWFSEYYKILAEAISNNCGYAVEMFGDYPGNVGSNLRIDCIEKFDNTASRSVPDWLSNSAADIIKRDRLLRNLPMSEAMRRVRAYYVTVEDFMQKRNVKCVVSSTIDQYVIDLVYLYCLAHDVPFIGYHMSLLPGLTLITARGELNRVRSVENDEVSQYVSLIADDKFRPNYVPKRSKIIKAGVERYLKGIARFGYYSFLHCLPQAKLNYHIEASRQESRKNASISVLKAVVRRFPSVSGQSNYIYLPLQFHPECNSEYWTRKSTYEDYERQVVDVCTELQKSIPVVVKEHPNMLGTRSDSLYSRLEEIGCEVLHPASDHRSLIDGSKAVLTLNSSAGIEALCHNKPVICLSRPYYASSGHVVVETSASEVLQRLPDLKSGASNALTSSVRTILEASLPVSLQDIWLKPSGRHLSAARQSAEVFARSLNDTMNAVTRNGVSISSTYTIRS